MNEPLAVGEFLAKFPQFRFDFEEYLLSTRHMDWLNERFGHFEAYLTGVETYRMSEDTIVRAIRDHLAKAVPAYSSLASIRALSDIPLMDKTDLRRNAIAYVSREFYRGMLWYKETSGRTGREVSIFYSTAFYFEYLFLPIRKMFAITRAPHEGSRALFCLTTDEGWQGGIRPLVIANPTKNVGLALVVTIQDHVPASIDYFVDLLTSLHPRVVLTSPTVLESLLAYGEGRWSTDADAPERVFTARSFLAERIRAGAQELFGAPVLDSYGMTEFGAIGYECVEQSGFHVDETSVLVEIIGPDGTQSGEGEEGEIVLSSVLNAAMPLLRYRTGDRGALVSTPCPCGVSGPRIQALSGWRVFCFRFPHGVVRSPAPFSNLLRRGAGLFPIEDFQVTQVDDTSLRVRVQPDRQVGSVKGLLRTIADRVADLVPDGIEVHVEAASLDAGPFERFQTLT